MGKRCPVDKILSIGCGEGSLERHLATLNAFKDLDAVDISPERVEKAREKANKSGHDVDPKDITGMSREEILHTFYERITYTKNKKLWVTAYVSDRWKGAKLSCNLVDADTGSFA